MLFRLLSGTAHFPFPIICFPLSHLISSETRVKKQTTALLPYIPSVGSMMSLKSPAVVLALSFSPLIFAAQTGSAPSPTESSAPRYGRFCQSTTTLTESAPAHIVYATHISTSFACRESASRCVQHDRTGDVVVVVTVETSTAHESTFVACADPGNTGRLMTLGEMTILPSSASASSIVSTSTLRSTIQSLWLILGRILPRPPQSLMIGPKIL